MRLNYKRTILIGFAFMSILAFWQFYDQVIPYILENIFGLSTFSANAIMSIDNILAIFMLPLFGALSDKTKTPLGKRTPYILFGTIGAVILMVVMGIFETNRNFTGFLVALVLILIVMAMYRTPAVAYMPDVTEKPLRSKANAIINLVGYLGGIFSTIVMMFMLKSEKAADGSSVYREDQSFMPVFLVVAAFMLVSVIIMVLTIRENKLPHIEDEPEIKAQGGKMPRDVKVSLVLILMSVFLWFMAYNAVTTALSRYCVEIWKVDLGTSSSYLLMATIAAIAAFAGFGVFSGIKRKKLVICSCMFVAVISYVLSLIISKVSNILALVCGLAIIVLVLLALAFVFDKFGRKKTVLLGITLMTVCYVIAIFIKEQTPLMYLIFALVGVGWAAINVNSFPMVVEMSSGSDVGKYTGFYYTFSMAAQITTPLLSGLLIDKLGFGYSVLFPYAVLFSALSFVTMIFVKHGDYKTEKKKSLLENFDVED